ncbi:MAG: DUF4179 domain-containing protein [Anaerolineae bacterium]|jgi:hypothetical protein|nr:DUF4179 domain-containing protein [Chloroflexota bacterium]
MNSTNDIKRNRLAATLEQEAQRALPDRIDLWPRILRSIEQRQAPAGRLLRPAPAVLSWALGILIFSLAVAGLADALGPLRGRISGMLPAWQVIQQQDLMQTVDISQSEARLTVTVDAIYRDANQVLVAYSLSGAPAGSRVDTVLTTAEGIALPMVEGAGLVGPMDTPEAALAAGEAAYISAYDAAALASAPGEVPLQLEIALRPLASEGGAETDSLTVGPPLASFLFDLRAPLHDETLTEKVDPAERSQLPEGALQLAPTSEP